MNIPTEKGDYIAQPAKWTVNETSKGLPQFACQWAILTQWNGSEWIDVSSDQLEITSFNVLFNHDGQANKINIDTLKTVFGWDGRSIAALNDTDWSQVQARLYLELDTYEGKTSMKVKYINTADSKPGGGSLKAADPQQIQSLDAKYGATLRAMNGSAPAKPANGKPATPGKFAPTIDAAADAAKKGAWADFKTKWDEVVRATPEEAPHRDDRFREIVEQLEVVPAKASAADWKKVSDYIKSISLAPAFADDDIPF